MQKLHLMNADNRDATVNRSGLMDRPKYRLGLKDKQVRFMRYLAAGEGRAHGDLAAELGEDYGEAIIGGDPEIDFERVGIEIQQTDSVYLSASGEVRFAPPKIVEVILGPDGKEAERREPTDVPTNVDDELPVRWTGKKIPKAQAVRKYLFSRTVQLSHVDGLTFDYLFKMARELHDEKVLVLVGAGSKGRDPLIFQVNGNPYRGFLEGRVQGEKYQLLLHLSNMELKRPAPKEK